MKARALVIAALLVAPLAGCSPITSSACVDWVDFASAADASHDATLVVVGSVVGSAGQRTLFGAFAPVHSFAVESVVKGELPAGSRQIAVASVPQTCNGDAGAFPDGDPLATDERLEIFLFEGDGEFRLLTPYDGAYAAPASKPLPWEPEQITP